MTEFIKTQAFKLAVLEKQIEYLNELFDGGELSDKGEDYVSEYINVLSEDIENMELWFYNTDVEHETIQNIYSMSKTINVQVSCEFKEHVSKFL